MFAENGSEALNIVQKEPVDVVISDMRMPGMDGAELLEKVMKISPLTARFVLSGQYDKEATLRSVGPVHQYFSKPCDIRQIKDNINHALKLRNCISGNDITELISRIETLPSIPQVYLEIVAELRKDEPDVSRITGLIEADLGFATKILQIVNSSFFGIPNHISDIRQAVTFLGLDVIRALVLYVKLFREFKSQVLPADLLNNLMSHSLSVAKYARIIAQSCKYTRTEEENLFTAACFHDVGKLIFFAYLPDKYQETVAYIREHHCTEAEAEKAVIGVTHAEVGAYLLCLWGLKDEIVEAILYHHQPSLSVQAGTVILPLLHIADHMFYEINPDRKPAQECVSVPDRNYLAGVGMANRLSEWLTLLIMKEGTQNHGWAV